MTPHLETLEQFRKGPAMGLQMELRRRDQALEISGVYPYSYIEKLWDDGYLASRLPTPINTSAGFLLRPLRKDSESQVEVASRFLFALALYIRNFVVAGLDFPSNVDVSQMSYQFGVARIPCRERDTVACQSMEGEFGAVVMYRGSLYRVVLCRADGTLPSVDALRRALEVITCASDPAEVPISYLTAMGRTDWATCREELVKDGVNADTIAAIDGAAVVLCLDDARWEDTAAGLTAALHGGACVGNRWYDKHQVIVSTDGKVALNFEHAFSDGGTWGRWVQSICDHMNGTRCLPAQPLSDDGNILRHLPTSLGKTFAGNIRTAEAFAKANADGVVVRHLVLPIGRQRLRELRISPDAVAQFLFHSGYLALHDKMAATYESCSTAKFFHGRTETIRTATPAIRAALSVRASVPSLQRAMMREISEAHSAMVKRCADGRGVDRHLAALHALALEKNDAAALNFFNESLYQTSKTWLMSTSNLSLASLENFVFGPVVEDGYGLAYGIDDKEIRVCVTSFKKSKSADAKELSAAIERSSEELLSSLTAE